MGTGRLLVVMCGLPGSGKSTIARSLAGRLPAPRWDKDEIRHLLFPPRLVPPGREINDACMELLYAALRPAFAHIRTIILDGRPYATLAQREGAHEAARGAGADIAFVVCTAPVAVLKQRVSADPHLAPDRDPALIDRLAAEWQPFEGDALVIDTSACTPAEATEACLRGLRERLPR